MKPYDICGAWYSDQHFLSGDVHRMGHLISQSVLWLNKASQETASEHIPIMNQMFRFYNCNGSFVRAAMFASCPVSDSSSTLGSNEMKNASSDSSLNHCERDGTEYLFNIKKNFEDDSKDFPCSSSNLQGTDK